MSLAARGLAWLGALTSLASVATATPTEPKITPAPAFELLARQNNDRGTAFVGYTSYQGHYYAQSCASGKSIIRSGGQWAGCGAADQTNFDIATACESGSVMICPTIKYTCGSVQPACASMVVYNNLDKTSAYSMVACFNQEVKMTLFEETTGSANSATTKTESKSSTTSSSSDGSSSSRATERSSSATNDDLIRSTASTTSITTSTLNSNSNSESGSSSNPRDLAWIAGPIVGGIAGIVIIALMIWIIKLLQRRKQEAANAAVAPVVQPGQPQAHYYPSYQWQVVGQQSPPQQGQAYGGYAIPAELHDSALPGELHTDSQNGTEKLR